MTNTINRELQVTSSQEKYRPQFHFTPATMWCNDPNGLVYFEGEYHLFYQYHPESMVWGPMHWGHAVSADLIHWEELPIALFPDEQGTIFSGGAVVDGNNTSGLVPGGGLVAMFTYHLDDGETVAQTQGIAYSQDKGRTWSKYSGNPVIPTVAKDFRDPKVFWYEPEQRWQMVIAVGDCMHFYKSDNLLEWDYQSRFSGGELRAVWEVPDLLSFMVDGQEKWVLLVSIGEYSVASGSGIQYFIGDFDGTSFTSDDAEIRWFDYGPDNYAGTTWTNEPSGKAIYIGWMSNWYYADKVPTSPWRGGMTLPRELSLTKVGGVLTLVQTAVSLDAIAEVITELDDYVVEEQLALEIDTLVFEVRLELDLHHQLTPLHLTFFDNTADQITLNLNTQTQSLNFERPKLDIEQYISSATAPIDLSDNKLSLHIIVDTSSIEIFANGTTLTSLFFSEEKTCSMVIKTEEKHLKLKHLSVNSLKAI